MQYWWEHHEEEIKQALQLARGNPVLSKVAMELQVVEDPTKFREVVKGEREKIRLKMSERRETRKRKREEFEQNFACRQLSMERAKPERTFPVLGLGGLYIDDKGEGQLAPRGCVSLGNGLLQVGPEVLNMGDGQRVNQPYGSYVGTLGHVHVFRRHGWNYLWDLRKEIPDTLVAHRCYSHICILDEKGDHICSSRRALDNWFFDGKRYYYFSELPFVLFQLKGRILTGLDRDGEVWEMDLDEHYKERYRLLKIGCPIIPDALIDKIVSEYL